LPFKTVKIVRLDDKERRKSSCTDANLRFLLQVVLEVVRDGQRPLVPDNLADLHGGTFDGVELYIDLMKKCWAQEPSERPKFIDAVTELQRISEHHSSQLRFSQLGAEPG
jgi:hypothetical protein